MLQRQSNSAALNRLANQSRTLAMVYFGVLFTATHIPSPPQDLFGLSDKFCHFGAYAGLAIVVLAAWELTSGILQAKHYFTVWLAATLFGVIDEWTQIPVGRTCDINDWWADALGVICGLFIFGLCRLTIYHMVSPGVTLQSDFRPAARK